MKNQFLHFNSLHESSEPLLIANAWNAQSSRVFEKLNYKAVATSSAAVAESIGYADGEQMSFDEYVCVVKSIVRSVKLPVSVDLEGGYGETPEQVIENIIKLEGLGVSGINIEDSKIENGKRSLLDANVFADRLKKITAGLKSRNVQMFINIRCDAFLLGLSKPPEEAKVRSGLFEAAGAHGLFLPCITDLDDIRAAVKNTSLPVNVMCMPQLPAFAKLKDAGVKRISMGNFINQYLYSQLEVTGKKITEQGSFASVF